eukprot:scaffold1048_cov90-Amphora_coffeaeformis.AAC.15
MVIVIVLFVCENLMSDGPRGCDSRQKPHVDCLNLWLILPGNLNWIPNALDDKKKAGEEDGTT